MEQQQNPLYYPDEFGPNHLFMQGKGYPILFFLHDIGSSSRIWQPIIDDLSQSFRCYAMDFPGHGVSREVPTNRSLCEMADPISSIIFRPVGKYLCGGIPEHVRMENKHGYYIVGHGMGGKVALQVATKFNFLDRLRGILLLAPALPVPEPMTEEQRIQAMLRTSNPEYAQETVRAMAKKPLTAAQLQKAVEDHRNTSREAWSSWWFDVNREDIGREVMDIAVPIHILAGADDPIIPATALHREYLLRLPNARMTIVRDLGHLIPYEAPGMVISFLRKLLPNPATIS